MYEIFTYGRFEVAPENEDAFVETRTEFASWASARPGAGTIRLFRDVRNPGRFVSLGQWDSAEGVQDWKSSPRVQGAARPAGEAGRGVRADGRT